MKIASKLGLSIVSAAVVAGVILGVIVYADVKNVLQQNVIEDQILIARNIIHNIESKLFQAQRDLHLLAEDEFLRTYISFPEKRTKENRELLLDEMKERAEMTGPWSDVTIVDVEGKLLLSHDAGIDKNIQDYQHLWIAFNQARNGLFYRSDVVKSDYADMPTVVFSLPIRGKENEVIGAVIANYKWITINSVMDLARRDASLHMFNSEGKIIVKASSHHQKHQLYDNIQHHPQVKRALLGEKSGFSFQSDINSGNPSLVIHVLQDKKGMYQNYNWGLLLEIPIADLFAPVRKLAWQEGVVVFLVLSILAFIFLIIAKRHVRPLVNLSRAASLIGKGNFEQPIDIECYRDNEIGELARSFNSMVKKLKERDDELLSSQKRYHSLFDNAQDLIHIVDTNGYIIGANKTEFELMGYPDVEYIGQPLLKFMHPDCLEEMNERCKHIHSCEDVDIYEMVLLTHSGRELILEVNSVPQCEDGKLIAIQSICRDITERKKVERALHDSEETFRSIANTTLEAIIMMNDTGQITFWNPAAGKIFGYTQDEVIGKDLHALLTPERYWEASSQGMKVFHKEGTGAALGKMLELEGVRKDGSEFPVEITINGLKIKGKRYAVAVIRDITARKESEQQLKNSEHAYHSLVDEINDGIVTIDVHGIITFASRTFMRMIEQEDNNKVVNHAMTEFIHADHKQEIEDIIKQDMSSGEIREEVETCLSRADGSKVYIQVRPSPIVDNENNLVGASAVIRDVSDHKQAEDEIAYRATHDSLTGLFNRDMMLQSLDSLIAQVKRQESQMAVLFIDLDEFKLINDTLGHDAGDELLCEVSDRLADTLRDSDILARHGGDEFILLVLDLREGHHTDEVEKNFYVNVAVVAQRILSAMKQPFIIKEQEVYIDASIGISIYPDDGEDKLKLLQHADSAMYRAKELGRGTYQYYSQELSTKQEKRSLLANRLHKAIEQDEFVLYYQPIVELDKGNIVGVEALIRWEQEGKLVSPLDFIPVAESTGLILPIGQWVLEEACRQVSTWQQQSIPIFVAVNLSVRQFWQGDITATVLDTIQQIGIDKEHLELEITESAMTHDAARMERILENFSAKGLSISLDDFGTGYSSLDRLKHLPINKLKIDKSFVDGIPFEEDNMAIVKAIIQMSASLGINSLAEGIETVEQWHYLREQGCRYGQGYYFSRPVPANEIEALWHTASGILISN